MAKTVLRANRPVIDALTAALLRDDTLRRPRLDEILLGLRQAAEGAPAAGGGADTDHTGTSPPEPQDTYNSTGIDTNAALGAGSPAARGVALSILRDTAAVERLRDLPISILRDELPFTQGSERVAG